MSSCTIKVLIILFCSLFLELKILYINCIELNDIEIARNCIDLYGITLRLNGVVDIVHIENVFNRFGKTIFSISSQHSAEISVKFSKSQINQNLNS